MNYNKELTPEQVARHLRESEGSGSMRLTGSREERRAQFRELRAADREKEDRPIEQNIRYAR